MHFNLSQSDSLKNNEGLINIDFIGKFENLMADLHHVLIHILHMEDTNFLSVYENSSSSRLRVKMDDITDDINLLHTEDFTNFGYIKKYN